MNICRVVIPFTDKETGELHKMDSEILVPDERLAEIRAVNVNMVIVLGKAKAEPKKAKAKKE